MSVLFICVCVFVGLQVEKQRMNMTTKTQQSEEAKTEYANQLQKTNEMQTLHYHTAMPEVFQHLQVKRERDNDHRLRFSFFLSTP